MLDSPEPIDYEPLILALQQANKMLTFNEQLAVIELAITKAEFHPNPHQFCQLLWAIEVMHGVDYSTRRWHPVKENLEDFFS